MPRVPPWLAAGDKLVHAGLYGVLGAALAYGRSASRPPPPHALVIALGMLYGATDEWHQAFVPLRSPDLGDWVADVVGVFLGYGLGLLLFRKVAHGETANTGEYGIDVTE